ncbi:MAG: DUF3795 domain-containing protein [Desulfobacteraceae bacterium]|nr:DUF3795 domain-containing protein [Desulfobacteraceae bacterium]MBU4054719.1 DUF3795 domain-containing protein [Pseudomonadota bacterium]
MDYKQMTAPCGIDCFNCAVYHAGENEKLRNRVAGNLGVAPEKAVCKGCRNENGTVACLNMTEPCQVYQCIQKKNLQFCFECSDFPCDHLHPYADQASNRPHNTKVFNSCLIKKMGLHSWAETKAKKVRDTYFKAGFKL